MKEATKKSMKESTAELLWQTWGGFSCLAGPSVHPLIRDGIQADSTIWATLSVLILLCYAFWLVMALTFTYRYVKSR